MRGALVAADPGDAAVAGLSTATLGAVCLGAAVPGAEAEGGPTLCPFRAAMGLPCPFCGLTRSLFAFGQGRVDASFELAPLGPLLPFLAAVAGAAAVAAIVKRRPLGWPPWALAAGTVLLVSAWVLQLARVAA
jgi:hypothetical protein